MSLSHCGTRRLSSTTVRSALLLLLFLALSARQTSAADSSQEPKPPNRQQEYLRKNVELQGVVELESGLQYQILKSGDAAGPSPGPNTPCAVHYRGTTIDRIEFDGTRGSMFGFPALFAPSGVIRGWTEAMQLMHEGDRWRLVIPQHLAYGERGAGSHIGPGATLIFDMELVKVFEGEARQYPGSFILENPVLGPIPSMDYFCVRTWMVLIVLIGWTEAMQLMHQGDRWRLVIPQHLAYGERGAGSHIGPGATLIFDMELVKVFEGEARQYPGSFILENPVLGPIPSMDYFCVRTWMVLIVLIGWLIYDICKTDKNDGLKKRR